MEDPSGYIAWWIVGAGIGAVAGAQCRQLSRLSYAKIN